MVEKKLSVLLAEKLEREKQNPPISTGLVDLDKMLGGGLASGLHLLCGPTGIGKTSLLLTMMVAAADQGRQVLFLSQEMDAGSVALMLARQVGIKNLAKYDDLIHIVTTKLTVEGCVNCILAHKKMLNVMPIVFLDHIQRVASTGPVENIRLAVVGAMQKLSDFCRDHGATVVAVSQVSGAYIKSAASDMRPKESEDAAFEADVALGLQLYDIDRENAKSGKSYASAAVREAALSENLRKIAVGTIKKRRGGPVKCTLILDAKRQCYINTDSEKTVPETTETTVTTTADSEREARRNW